MIFRKELQPERVTAESIRRFRVNRGWPFPDAIVRGGGCGAVNGCFLIAQLEAAFVKSKFYLFKMAPWLPPKMHGMLRIKTKKRNQFTQQEIRGNNR